MRFFQRIVMGARRELTKRAEVCVLPNEERVKLFKKQTGTSRPVECVWNVPRLEEVAPAKEKPNLKQPLALFYGGSLSSERLPDLLINEILDLNPKVILHVVGYPTYSHHALYERVCELSKTGLIRYFGAMPRNQIWKIADLCEAALCLMPGSSQDINLRHMVGASNKPFDAMARGLAVVVSEFEEWKNIYLEESTEENKSISDLGLRISDFGEGTRTSLRIPESGKGYGIAINPDSRESIRVGLEWMLTNREKLWEMGERGRYKIQNDWNYEKAFFPVLDQI